MSECKSIEQSDSVRLCFNSHQDAINFVSKGVEEANCRLSANKFNIADSYEKGILEICLHFTSRTDAEHFQLVLRSVPLPNETEGTSPKSDFRFVSGRRRTEGNNDFMFIGVAESIKTPEKIITTSVWLARNHHVKDFLRNVLRTSLFSQLRIRQSSPKGKWPHFPFVLAAIATANPA